MIYRHHGRPRWLHLGDVRSIGLADARRSRPSVVDVVEGKDPAAERKAERATGTFADLATSTLSCTPGSTTRAGGRPSGWSPVICCRAGASSRRPPSAAPTSAP